MDAVLFKFTEYMKIPYIATTKSSKMRISASNQSLHLAQKKSGKEELVFTEMVITGFNEVD
jgi:hypothetical protein